jgi:hypothetical protein
MLYCIFVGKNEVYYRTALTQRRITVRLGPASPVRHGSNLLTGGSSRKMPGAYVFIVRLILVITLIL